MSRLECAKDEECEVYVHTCSYACGMLLPYMKNSSNIYALNASVH